MINRRLTMEPPVCDCANSLNEVAEIATLICDFWRELPDDDPTYNDVLKAAWRIYDAGFRKQTIGLEQS